MTTNQEGVHAAIRAETGTSGTYLEDWHALFTADGIAAGPWNARMIAWVNATLGTSYTSLNTAMNAFAIDQGFTSWQDMNTLVLAVSGAMEMLDGESQGWAIVLTDNYHFDGTGFYGSAAIKDTTTPANNYDGAPDGLNITSDDVPFDTEPPTYGAEVSTEIIRLRRNVEWDAPLTIITTLTDGGTAFKAGVVIGGPDGNVTAWDGTAGASVPGGLSGACIVTDVVVLPSGMTTAELETATA